MIHNDWITMILGGGKDSNNNPLPTTDVPARATVTPVRSSESVKAGQAPLTLFYRLVIGPRDGAQPTPTSGIRWMGRTLQVQGDVEPWVVKGRISHYEATLKSPG